MKTPSERTQATVTPVQQVADAWRKARERLLDANAAFDAALAEQQEAARAEQQAWSEMEEVAGRVPVAAGPLTPCAPPPMFGQMTGQQTRPR